MKKEDSKILKVVYFDEGSAIDYLDIYNGGVKSEIRNRSILKKFNARSGAEAEIKTGILFKALVPFLKINLKGDINGEISHASERILKTTISNTILTDYIDIANQDEKVCKLENYTVSAHKDTISYMKMYTPYFNMVKIDSAPIDFSAIDETLEKGKGFYELIAENKNGDKKVLRFNIKAFRNNYNLIDLTRMDLTFYSIEVGRVNINQLVIKNEFDFNESDDTLTADDILERAQVDDISGKTRKEETVSFYDVVLAGIVFHE
jgi:hypothetical protein